MPDAFHCGGVPSDEDLRVVAAFRDFLNGDRLTVSPDPADGLLTVVRDGQVVHSRTLQPMQHTWLGEATHGDPRYEDTRRHETVRHLMLEQDLNPRALMYLFNWNSAVGAAYHNIQHLYTVAINALEGAAVESAPAEDRTPLLLAALFHDIDHSRSADDDQINIDRAVAAFDHATTTVFRNVDEATTSRARELIQATLFPHRRPADLTEAVIMDADLMQTFEPDRERWLNGLVAERPDLTIADAIQVERDAVFLTKWGRSRRQEQLARN